MKLPEATAECQRWLDYLERQKETSAAMQRLASDRRTGKCDHAEGQRRLAAIDRSKGLTVYDGAKLAEAVTFLLKHVNGQSLNRTQS
jgi:hypothetical protein